MKQPDFIFGGATRSGLEDLIQILDDHAQIFIPQRKEHQFFHQEKILAPVLETCRMQFEDAVNPINKKKIPENRTLHGEQEFDPTRAHSGCPHAKIIFTLRDPVERAYLQFLNALQEKKETVRSFEHAMESELSGLRSPDTTGRCWVYKNQYQTHIEHWLSFYPKEKIHLMIYEEWSDPAQIDFRALEEFLGLPLDSTKVDFRNSKINTERDLQEKLQKKYPPLPETTREQLEDILGVDKKYIANFIGRTIPKWRRTY